MEVQNYVFSISEVLFDLLDIKVIESCIRNYKEEYSETKEKVFCFLEDNFSVNNIDELASRLEWLYPPLDNYGEYTITYNVEEKYFTCMTDQFTIRFERSDIETGNSDKVQPRDLLAGSRNYF